MRRVNRSLSPRRLPGLRWHHVYRPMSLPRRRKNSFCDIPLNSILRWRKKRPSNWSKSNFRATSTVRFITSVFHRSVIIRLFGCPWRIKAYWTLNKPFIKVSAIRANTTRCHGLHPCVRCTGRWTSIYRSSKITPSYDETRVNVRQPTVSIRTCCWISTFTSIPPLMSNCRSKNSVNVYEPWPTNKNSSCPNGSFIYYLHSTGVSMGIYHMLSIADWKLMKRLSKAEISNNWVIWPWSIWRIFSTSGE